MPFFIDTSALFKRYQPERGTDAVCRILESKDDLKFISAVSIIEVISNLKRLCEIDKITTEEQFYLQRSFFYQDIENLDVTIIDIMTEDIIKADGLILKRYMKPLDSIQLAIALKVPVNGLTFVCSDNGLCNIAESEGLLILNPEAVL